MRLLFNVLYWLFAENIEHSTPNIQQHSTPTTWFPDMSVDCLSFQLIVCNGLLFPENLFLLVAVIVVIAIVVVIVVVIVAVVIVIVVAIDIDNNNAVVRRLVKLKQTT